MLFYTAYQNQKKNRHSKKSERFNKPNKDRKTPRLNRNQNSKGTYQHIVKSILRTAYLIPPLRY